MRVVLAAINASYTHTPLALYALRAYCGAYSDQIEIASFTINQSDDTIVQRLFELNPDILGFSCAIWNIVQTVRVVSVIRQILPHTAILFGGPEVADEYDEYLLSGLADAVVPGEGEQPFYEIVTRSFQAGQAMFDGIPGVSCLDRSRSGLIIHPPGSPVNPSALPFPYDADMLRAFEHKIIYYEASRGCPFHCGYCLSSLGGRERYKPLEQIYRELQVFLDAGVKRVKFTDRTFNTRKDCAMSVWRFLADHDNGITNFHFEIAADLLDEDALTLLAQARPGLFQFEIGVQSVNPRALSVVSRITNQHALFAHVARLREALNIHMHLDLIAGLPGEDYTSFQESYNAVYKAQPDQLQLGFLKLLKGTPLRKQADALGLIYQAHPPYEVLYTREIDFRMLTQLKAVAEMTELFHNSGKFTLTLRYILRWFPSPFALFDSLAQYWRDNRLFDQPHGKLRMYAILHDFGNLYAPDTEEKIYLRDLLRFDILANENEKGLPDWLTEPPSSADKPRIRAYLRQLNGVSTAPVSLAAPVALAAPIASAAPVRIERFNTDIWGWVCDPSRTLTPRTHYLLFRYPEPGRQNPFSLQQRVKEVDL